MRFFENGNGDMDMMIIKVGGGESINVEGIIKDLKRLGEKAVIVHGANHARDELMKKLGHEKKILLSVSGYSSVYSDDTAIDMIMMAYSGLRNKRIVELCQRNGVDAIGLSGIDGKMIQGKRNQGIRIKDGQKIKIIRDNSGKPDRINSGLLKMLLELGYLPILCIPILDENGHAINSENDDIVALLKDELKADKVVQFIEARGFLDDKDDPESLMRSISSNDLKEIEAKADGRMKRKILALKRLFEKGSCKVIIADGRTECPLSDALEGKGTVVI
jgi:[amino group carrier protein]-L-2-aminoadipate 6-kinase